MKRVVLVGLALAVSVGVGTGLWSAREGQGPPEGPWQDSRGRLLPDGTNREQGFPLVVHVYQGHEHCDWQTVTFLNLTWPPGTVARSPLGEENIQQYVRDPEKRIGPPSHFAGSFDPDTTLPTWARATGFHNDGWELWVGRSDTDRYIYVRNDRRTERWPRALSPIYCK